MPKFQVGDTVRVALPRGYNKRGVYGVHVMYATEPGSRFEGAVGTVTDIDPLGTEDLDTRGPRGVARYLVDFRQHDNSRVGIPWQVQWFREEWLELVERPRPATAQQGSQQEAAAAASTPA
ncbi:MAG: hypothetical protein KatS3mg059_1579 [Thermomicrobiales bacterium]|nr:MAG: hypothetical protein KatS3mg059_1579 [Thermomicrobiales bacterium]